MSQLTPDRQDRPADDPIFALNAEATRRRGAGESIVNATLGTLMDDDGGLLVLETAARALHDVPRDEWAAYAPLAGLPAFQRAVIDDCFRGRDDLARCATACATAGGTGALRHAVVSFLRPGEAVLTTSFHWAPYRTICDEHGRRVDVFSMFDQAGGLDVGALERGLVQHLATQGRVLLILNDPCQNPCGYSMTGAEWRAVADVLARHASRGPITLLVDMAYYLYGSAKDSRTHLDVLRPLLGRIGLLFAWSASKSFTHYGLRVGAIVACEPDEVQRRSLQAAFTFACRGTWSNCNRGGQALVTQLLVDPALARGCDAEREAAKELLMGRVRAFNARAIPAGLRYPRYEGGFFVTVFCDDSDARARRMREAHGVFVVPQRDSLRVALCSVPERDVARVVEALAD
ncbi:MAG: aminotransferase class I/II-fold pyridoxal phosphate-dependent enzyme [Planctomycetes bacterium]|nr:aminotransferase class I/II-fold pyridoxal phosphate-dependent enzyme [Planctomycetota bacterium]